MRLLPQCLLVCLGLLPAFTLNAFQDDVVPKLGSGEALSEGTSLDDIRYQIGSEWGKIPVSAKLFEELEHLERIAKGTVNIRGATGFYLGEFNGEHLFATNNHVCPSAGRCVRQTVKFTLLGLQFTIDSLIGTWPEIDLAILTAKIPENHKTLLDSVSNPFNFSAPIFAGQKLITVGFGIASNQRRQLVANWDVDCIVFSEEGDYRLMRDPDQFNTGAYRTWSFANGCDVSHGDSGSAMVDRETGAVIGLIWTGKIPKSSIAQDSATIQSWIAEQSTKIWTELSYAVPVEKIAVVLDEFIDAPSSPERSKKLLTLLRSVQ